MEAIATLASTALPALIDVAVPAIASSLSQNENPQSTPSPPSRIPVAVPPARPSGHAISAGPMDVHDVLSNPSLPKRPSFLDTPSNLGPCMTLPFQFTLLNWTGAHKMINLDLAAAPELKKLVEPYRFAKLLNLEVIICPRQSASKYSGTAEIRFCPSDVTPSPNEMMDSVGTVSVSCGGPIGFISNSAIACPLDRFSPVIKSPFLPTDRIRVVVNHWLNTEATKVNNTGIIFSSILRGTVLVAYPSFG
nr:MAG: coat superfamily protein [brine shrimp tymo-like virus 1]